MPLCIGIMTDLISDGNGGKVNNLPQLDGGRSTAHHWHVVGEHAEAGKRKIDCLYRTTFKEVLPSSW